MVNPKAVAPSTWARLTAADIMQKELITVPDSAPLSDVERALSDNKVSGLPVVNSRGRIVGVISMRDLVDRYTQDPDARPRRGHASFYMSSEELDETDAESFEVPDEAEETAGDVMTAAVHSIEAAAPLAVVARTMVELQIHRLLVESEGRHVGLVSTMDLLRAIANADARAKAHKPAKKAGKKAGAKRPARKR